MKSVYNTIVEEYEWRAHHEVSCQLESAVARTEEMVQVIINGCPDFIVDYFSSPLWCNSVLDSILKNDE